MIQYRRPPEPSTFRRAAPRPATRGPFKPIWRDHKGAFSQSQHGKCGYCESDVAGTQDGDVEHYAPKAAVHDLVPTALGTEAEPGLARLRKGSRKTVVRSTRGYTWLAYEWTNYLFACAVCNQKYKGNVFPLAPVPPAGWKPSKGDAIHRPLLLNCYDDGAPWRHFQFDPLTGTVVGTTARGVATVGTCGLHRATLRKPRRQAIADAVGCCAEILAPAATERSSNRAWRDLGERGRDDRPFAGAVRGVAEERLGLAWEQIVAYVATLPPG